jgi:serine/threonine-protein kinase RsbW
MAKKILKVKNRISELAVIESFLEELGNEWDIDIRHVLSLNLVLEEAFTNIVSYGYDDEAEHIIDIYFLKDGENLEITVSDDGHEWDPTMKEDPDITLSAEERPVGGLGIFLIRKMMDNVSYRRSDNLNILTMTKKIDPPEE